jgi:acyl-CoA thioesterase I
VRPLRLIGFLAMICSALPGSAGAQSAMQNPSSQMECPVGDPLIKQQSEGISLPNLSRAAEERRKIKILTIGATTASARAPDRDYANLIKSYLESSIKGLETKIIDRGTSGELAEEGGRRLRLWVSLKKPDLVLWQVGTFDAMANVAPADFEQTLVRTAKWLRKNNVDLVLVGVHYIHDMAGNESYQAFRKVINKVAAREGILRIGRYEAVEIVERAMRNSNRNVDSFQMTEASYHCMADMVARSIETSLTGKK